MKRKYTFNPINLDLGPDALLNLAKTEYLRKYPTEIQSKNNPFAYCLIYFVVNQDKTMRLDFRYPKEVPLTMEIIHKRPKRMRPGEKIRNIDIREITNILGNYPLTTCTYCGNI